MIEYIKLEKSLKDRIFSNSPKNSNDTLLDYNIE